jgi:hypothetical protein
MKKTILVILGIIASIASVIGVFYFGFVFMFVGGIVQIIEAAKVTPVVSSDIAWGVGKICLTSISTLALAFVSLFLNVFMWSVIGSIRK